MKQTREDERLHRSSTLLREAADDLAGFYADHRHIMSEDDRKKMRERIREVRRVSGTLLRRARLVAARRLP